MSVTIPQQVFPSQKRWKILQFEGNLESNLQEIMQGKSCTTKIVYFLTGKLSDKLLIWRMTGLFCMSCIDVA